MTESGGNQFSYDANVTWEQLQSYHDEGPNEGPTEAQRKADPGDARLPPHSSDVAGWKVSVDTQEKSASAASTASPAVGVPGATAGRDAPHPPHSPDVAGWKVGGDTGVNMGPELRSVCADRRRWKTATTMTQRLCSKNFSVQTFRPCHCGTEHPEVCDVGQPQASPESRADGPSRTSADDRCASETCAYEPSRETIFDDDWDGEV